MADTENNEQTENSETAETSDAAGETNEIPEIDSKYRMILLAAQRSKQLQRGANPRVNVDPRKSKPTRIAMEELKNKKVNFKILDED